MKILGYEVRTDEENFVNGIWSKNYSSGQFGGQWQWCGFYVYNNKYNSYVNILPCKPSKIRYYIKKGDFKIC